MSSMSPSTQQIINKNTPSDRWRRMGVGHWKMCVVLLAHRRFCKMVTLAPITLTDLLPLCRHPPTPPIPYRLRLSAQEYFLPQWSRRKIEKLTVIKCGANEWLSYIGCIALCIPTPDGRPVINQIFKSTADSRAIYHDVYHGAYSNYCSTPLSMFSHFLCWKMPLAFFLVLLAHPTTPMNNKRRKSEIPPRVAFLKSLEETVIKFRRTLCSPASRQSLFFKNVCKLSRLGSFVHTQFRRWAAVRYFCCKS